MQQVALNIEHIPAILWNEPSDKIYLYMHGQGGNKEEARMFAYVAAKKHYQVLSIDLPQHGQRCDTYKFEPQDVIPELHIVMNFLRLEWSHISLCANSIGAWFAMMSYAQTDIEQCLFISPIVDMHALITQMMKWSNVDVEQLQKEKQIVTNFNQTLSWDYYQFVVQHPIVMWNHTTHILYAEFDEMTSYLLIKNFQDRFACEVTIMKNGEHWFHTTTQLEYLEHWFQQKVKE